MPSPFLCEPSLRNSGAMIVDRDAKNSVKSIPECYGSLKSSQKASGSCSTNDYSTKRTNRTLSSHFLPGLYNDGVPSAAAGEISSDAGKENGAFSRLHSSKRSNCRHVKVSRKGKTPKNSACLSTTVPLFSFVERFREKCEKIIEVFRRKEKRDAGEQQDLLMDVSELGKILKCEEVTNAHSSYKDTRVIFYASPSNPFPCDYCILFSEKEYAVKNLRQISEALYSYNLGGSIDENCFSLSILQWRKILSLRITLRDEFKLQFYKTMTLLHNATAAGCPDLPFSENVSELTDAQKKYLLYLALVDILGSFENCLHDNIFPVHVPSLRDEVWRVHTKSLVSFLFGPVNEDYIYNYFGAEIAFYFSWMNHSSRWLLCASCVGLVMKISKDLLPPTSLLRPFITPVYTLVVVIGGVICIKIWERRVETLFMRYRLFHNLHRDEKNWQYRGKSVLDEATGREKICYPSWKRFFIFQPFSWIIVVGYIGFTFLVTVCSANLDLIIHDKSWLAIPSLQRFASPGELFGLDSPFYWIPIALYFFSITLMSKLFCSLARKLTEMENYEYRGDFFRALTQKRFALESVNRYSKLLLVLFVTQSKPMLIQNIKAIFIIEEILRIFVETARPALCNSLSKVFVKSKTTAPPSAALDEALPFYEVYQDFIEMAIQLGYIVLFTSAYPIAPTVAALAQLVELKGDLFALCYTKRRPVPRYGTRQLATWCDVFRLLVLASVFTNAFLFVFCGSGNAVRMLLHLFPSSKEDGNENQMMNAIILFIVIEHLLVLLSLFLYWRIPCQPKQVKDYVEKRRFAQTERKGYAHKSF